MGVWIYTVVERVSGGVSETTGRRTLVARLDTRATPLSTGERRLLTLANTTLSKGQLDTESTPLGE